MKQIASLFARLRRAQEGVAMVEFAYSLLIVVPLFLGGAELTNYVVTKMRISQLALHVADNASRIGTESLLSDPRISETQINDLLTGANLQAGSLDLENRGRVLISSVEPVADPNTTHKFKIHWQRCYGELVWPSSYGKAGDTNLNGVGPAGQQVTAPDGNGVIFVEIAYDYQPLISSAFAATTVINETAAMTVRDDRDYDGNGGIGIYNDEEAEVHDDC